MPILKIVDHLDRKAQRVQKLREEVRHKASKVTELEEEMQALGYRAAYAIHEYAKALQELEKIDKNYDAYATVHPQLTLDLEEH